jgi:hypothetical protein
VVGFIDRKTIYTDANTVDMILLLYNHSIVYLIMGQSETCYCTGDNLLTEEITFRDLLKDQGKKHSPIFP